MINPLNKSPILQKTLNLLVLTAITKSNPWRRLISLRGTPQIRTSLFRIRIYSNDRGQAVGYSHSGGDILAFLWTAEDGMQSIGTPGGSIANGINNRGEVVGRSVFPETGAFLWTEKDGFIDLPTLGGTDSNALSINDLGQVVGESLTESGPAHAFLWTAKNGIQDLGTLAGTSTSFAFDINNKKQVVGMSGAFGPPVIWEIKG